MAFVSRASAIGWYRMRGEGGSWNKRVAGLCICIRRGRCYCNPVVGTVFGDGGGLV